MKLQPLLPWILLGPYLAAVVGLAVWQFMHFRRKTKPLIMRWLRRSFLLLLPGLIALGPSVQGGVSAPGVSNIDVYFAVDTTPSMAALDYAGARERLEGVKYDMQAIAAGLQGAHMEIITFDTEASVVLPLSSDPTAFQTASQGMQPEINSYSKGSTIDKPLDLLGKELKAGSTTYPDHYRLLFYMGDGEQTASAAVKPFTPLAKYINGGAVLGYGTTTGAKIIKYTGVDDDSAPKTYVTTIDGNTNKLVPAISHLDPAALQKIATALKVTYQDRNQGGQVNSLYQASQTSLAVDKSQHVVHYFNLYWLLAIPLAGLVFWEWQLVIVRLIEMRPQHPQRHAARSKRQGGRHDR